MPTPILTATDYPAIRALFGPGLVDDTMLPDEVLGDDNHVPAAELWAEGLVPDFDNVMGTVAPYTAADKNALRRGAMHYAAWLTVDSLENLILDRESGKDGQVEYQLQRNRNIDWNAKRDELEAKAFRFIYEVRTLALKTSTTEPRTGSSGIQLGGPTRANGGIAP